MDDTQFRIDDQRYLSLHAIRILEPERMVCAQILHDSLACAARDQVVADALV